MALGVERYKSLQDPPLSPFSTLSFSHSHALSTFLLAKLRKITTIGGTRERSRFLQHAPADSRCSRIIARIKANVVRFLTKWRPRRRLYLLYHPRASLGTRSPSPSPRNTFSGSCFCSCSHLYTDQSSPSLLLSFSLSLSKNKEEARGEKTRQENATRGKILRLKFECQRD